jgi:hypothetical protein
MTTEAAAGQRGGVTVILWMSAPSDFHEREDVLAIKFR